MKDNKALFAVYRSMKEVKITINSLKRFGFDEQDFSVLRPLHDGSKDFPHLQFQNHQLKNGALVGAILGIITVGLFYIFATNGVSPFTIFSAFSMSGGVVTMFLGVLLGSLVGAGIGVLVGIGTPDPAGKRYGQYLQSGGFLLSVNITDPEKMTHARSILETTGGQDIHVRDRRETWNSALMENIKLTDLETENRFVDNQI